MTGMARHQWLSNTKKIFKNDSPCVWARTIYLNKQQELIIIYQICYTPKRDLTAMCLQTCTLTECVPSSLKAHTNPMQSHHNAQRNTNIKHIFILTILAIHLAEHLIQIKLESRATICRAHCYVRYVRAANKRKKIRG